MQPTEATETPRNYTAADVARMAGVSDTTIRNWADKGALVGFTTPSGRTRYTREEVRMFFAKFGFAMPAELRERSA